MSTIRSTVEIDMAWTEQTGKHAWRVRYPASDGHIASVSGFTSQKAADDYAADIETDQRRRLWIDPALGKTTVEDWATRWLPSLDIDIRTFGNYSGHLRNHILPRWGTTPLAELSTLDITGWIKQLHDSGYAPATVSGFVKLLSMMLEDAVDEHFIPINPVRRRRRRGRRAARRQPEKIWATTEEVIRIAAQAAALTGDTIGTLIITAAWTGCRWGELAGLHRTNLHLDTGHLIVHPDFGALHEYSRMRWIGPPKTTASARSIALPPILITLLRQHLDQHDHEFVFTNSHGNWLWHSDVIRRGLRPATDGNFDLATTYPHLPDPARTHVPRTPPQPQDMAHRQRRPRDRAVPTARSPPARPGDRGLLPCRARSRTTAPQRTATTLAKRDQEMPHTPDAIDTSTARRPSRITVRAAPHTASRMVTPQTGTRARRTRWSPVALERRKDDHRGGSPSRFPPSGALWSTR
jgi:integrase